MVAKSRGLYWQSKSALATRKAEWSQSQAIIRKLEQTVPIAEKRAAAMKNLLSKSSASEMNWLDVEEQRIVQIQDLEAERAKAAMLLATMGEVEQQMKVYHAQFNTPNLTAITDTQRQLASLQEEYQKATELNAKQILYAPVDGTVKQMVMNTVGGVVTPAQILMEIVPQDETLVVEAWLENKDIGFVHEGQPAEIKIHTFPFTKYGIIDGEVLTISSDAIADEQRGLIYKMKIEMKKNSILVEGRDVVLMPGMAVSTEVQTGHRRIIEFISAPLLRYKLESVKER